MQFDGINQFWWGIQNDIYGFQLGAESVLYDDCCRFKIEGFAKAGIYGNNAKVSTDVLSMQEVDESERAGMDHTTFVGELGIVASYELSCCWSLRAGYQAMWLDGVLVAANQVPGTDDFATTIAFNYTDAFFHGGLIQLERRW